VLDVGGGPGRYAVALADQGYEVTLIEPVELHAQQARSAAQQAGVRVEVRHGDARRLDEDDASVDAVLLLGPLYHLDDQGRRQSLAEAKRVLRPGGVLIAAAISRFASLLDGLRQRWLDDPQFASIVERDLATGEHRNPDPVENPRWFTTAWFHRPDELRTELSAAGFNVDQVVAVEGPLWLLGDLEQRWADEAERNRLLAAVRAVEDEPSMLGVTAHLLAAANRPTLALDRPGER
jgi:SAM-dependent methyltransferase